MPCVIFTVELLACCGLFCLLSAPLGDYLPISIPVLAQLALTLCIHPIVEHSQDRDAAVLLAGALAAAIGVVFGKQQHR